MPPRDASVDPRSRKPDKPNDDDDDSYAEGTPLTWIFGNHPKVKLIATLLSEPEQDVNISDLSRMSGVSRSAIYDHLDELVEHDIVVPTRTVGNSQMYQIAHTDRVATLATLEENLLENKYGQDD